MSADAYRRCVFRPHGPSAVRCRHCGLVVPIPAGIAPHQVHSQCRGMAAAYRAAGTGTWLHRLLAWIRITEAPGCGCGSRAQEMDAQGIAWCLLHLWTIAGWLASAAVQRWPRLARLQLVCRLAAMPLVLAAIAAALVEAAYRRSTIDCSQSSP